MPPAVPMARRRSSGDLPESRDQAAPERARELWSIALFVLGALSLFGLISGAQGVAIDFWASFLGWALGAWSLGLAIGLIVVAGLLVHDNARLLRRLTPTAVVGWEALFFLIPAWLHVASPLVAPLHFVQEGLGGGRVGWAIWFLLSHLGGAWGASLLLLAGTAAALAAGLGWTRDAVLERWKGGAPRAATRPAQPGPEEDVWLPGEARSRRPKRTEGRVEPLQGASGGPTRAPRVPSKAAHSPVDPEMLQLLTEPSQAAISEVELRDRVRLIEETLGSFGVPVRVVEVNPGPTVTQFGLEPGYVERRGKAGQVVRSKVKVSRITALSNDLALALAAAPIRIEAPVPGRPLVGVEVPNVEISLVGLRGVMESEGFERSKGRLKLGLGRDVTGRPVVADLGKMPHLLIAGATGSGKSVCINSLIAALLCQKSPQELRLLMIDPKRVELMAFRGIPHLLGPVVAEVGKVLGALRWVVREMEGRYRQFAEAGARDIEGYNRKGNELPYWVVIVDELADLMMAAPEEVERTLCRLAQMARATGIHLVVATQRPSVDVVTGLIKANFPARLSFAVASGVDSRVILDTVGAEKLLGRGDMLYMASDSSKVVRLQGCYVSDEEISKIVRYWKGLPVGEARPPVRRRRLLG